MSPKPPIIFVLGCPASGKGTLSTLLSAHYPLSHLSVGDLLRRIRTENFRPEIPFIKSALERQELVESRYLFPILRNELVELRNGEGEGKKAVLLDGFPRSWEQLVDFEREFGKPAMVLDFHCEKAIAKERYLSRKLKGREGDDESMFEKRYALFEREEGRLVFEGIVVCRVETGGETGESWGVLKGVLGECEVWKGLMG